MENKQLGQLLKYLKIFYKRRYLFIFISLLSMTGLIAGIYTLPEKYRADSTIIVEDSVIRRLVEGIAITPEVDSHIETLRYSILSREVLTQVLNNLEYDLNLNSDNQVNAKIKELQNRTEIDVRGGRGRSSDNLFQVSITDQDPRFAYVYINTLVREFVEQSLANKRDDTYGANRFLEEQLVAYKNKLDVAENRIVEFRKKNGVFSTSNEQTIIADIEEIEREINQTSLEIETLSARRNNLVRQRDAIEKTVSLFSESQNNDRIGQLKQRLSQLLNTYTQDYPEVIQIKSEIEEMKANIQDEEVTTGSTMTSVNPLYQEIQQNIIDMDGDLSAHQTRLKRLRQIKAQKEDKLQNVPETQKELAMLTQERDAVRRIYDQLLTRMGQSDVSKQMEIGDKTTNFRIVDPAILPTRPVSPDMVKMIVLAILGGLGFGGGLVLVMDQLSSSISDISELPPLGVEVLAVIPTIKNEARERSQWRLDLGVYLLAAIYFSGILGLLGFEFMKQAGII